MAKKLWNADAAMAEAAIQAGCRFFAGYPITPATEILEHFAERMPEVGGVFIQAESELASINMVAGAAGTGTRSMTATAGQGFDLMQEGMQHSVAAELPFVVGQLSRVGPGGNLQPYQGDYFQATRGGAHGGYHIPVYAPATVGETVDFTQKAFYIADKYRTPVEILAEGILGHTIDPAEIGV